MTDANAGQTEQAGSNDATPTGIGTRSWLRLLVAILFVVVTIAVAVRLREVKPEAARPRPVSGARLIARDDFTRPSDPTSLGRAEFLPPWTALTGIWGIAGEAAYVSSPLEENIAVLDAGVSASTSALITGPARCGVVAGLTDETDYVALIRDPSAGVWNLVRRLDMTNTELAALPAAKSDPEAVSLTIDPPMVTASAGGRTASVVVEGLSDGRRGGMIASGPGASSCAFDEIVISTTSGD